MANGLLTSPFIYGRPVRPNEFFDRVRALKRVFGRLRNAESTAIVGEPHIGKSSLLLKLADRETQQEYLGGAAERLIVTLIDLHPISNHYSPKLFWKESLENIAQDPPDEKTAQLVSRAREREFDRRSLERLFNHLGLIERQVVLLLDEFEQLLRHRNFKESNFFPLLRSLSTRTGGLVVVPASRLSVDEMNKLAPTESGSPYFNNLIDVMLLPFDEATVKELLARAGDRLLPNDAAVIDQVAGRHPFLTQAMAAALYEEPISPGRYSRAVNRFYEEVSFHFEDLWHFLDDRTRAAAVIVSLLGLGSEALGQDFAHEQLGQIEELNRELRRLARVGLAHPLNADEPSDWKYSICWHGERWTIGAQAFAWWVREVVVSGLRVVPSFEQWLSQERYRSLLSPDQWAWLVSTVRESAVAEERQPYGSNLEMTHLKRIVVDLFNETELRELCFDLQIDFEDLPGTSKTAKVREMVTYCQRHGRLEELRQAIVLLRPHISTTSNHQF